MTSEQRGIRMQGRDHGQDQDQVHEATPGADPCVELAAPSELVSGELVSGELVSGNQEISGLIRRVRRLSKWSQRQLAHELGVTQSAVAKWETGRTTPSVRMLVRILDVVQLSLVASSGDGERIEPMQACAARDAAGRRYPAHTFVWAEGWWTPEGAETTAWYDQILRRSEELELPRVRYSRSWRYMCRRPSTADLNDHPTWSELVAEANESWKPPQRRWVSLPEWSFRDTRKSRNRRPEEFRALARNVSIGMSSRRT